MSKSKTDPKMIQNVVDRHAFDLFSMSNLPPSDTGVEGAVIWVSVGEFSGSRLKHGPRVKVVLGTKITKEGLRNSVSVKLTNPPEVLGTLPGNIERMAVQFVNRNREVLLQYWNAEISTKEMVNLIEMV